jgi:phage/plasmid-like protein (TIGR03299 family)
MKRAAGLDWTVRKEKMYIQKPVVVPDGVVVNAIEVPNSAAIVRDKDDAILGTATNAYRLIQNEVLFETIDTVLDLTDSHYETAGSLYGGKMVWALAKVASDFYIKGDGSPYADFIFGLTGHDGRHALVLGPTPIRILCGNTAQMAVEGSTGKYIIHHTANAEKRLEDVKAALSVRNKYLDTFKDAMAALMAKPMTLDEVKTFTEVLLPVDPEVKNPFKTLAMRDDIVRLFNASENLQDVPLSAYRTLQAVMEHTDQSKSYGKNGKAADRKAQAIVEGNAFNLKSRAVALLT